ncbi:MAG TPA: S41 family peptidase [Prosthecobacter sp.]|nr:S41 family peptidase [Prosthecobacter sp.]
MLSFPNAAPPVFSLAGKAAGLWLAAVFCQAAAQGAEPARGVDELSQGALQNAFQILRGEYIRGADLTHDELNRAAFQGLLDRLDLGAELAPRTEALPALTRTGLLAELLADDILYLKPRSFDEGTAPAMEQKLRGHARTRHLILDLRSPAPPGEFELAAAMLELFLPRGELMFKLKQPGRDDARLFLASREPVWTRPVILLADAETCNLGETLAAVLRARRQALVVGEKTRGATVRYESLPLDDAWLLRFARAEMLLADDTSFFKKGVPPDFPVRLPAADKHRIFDARVTVGDTIFDTQVPRFNEAALLARKNPEIESYIRRSTGGESGEDAPLLRDTVLQRAVDMLRASAHLEASKVKWPAARPEPAGPAAKKAPPAADVP